mgnify:CR=1 FL=1
MKSKKNNLPLRMCIVCRQMKLKSELVRVVKTKDNALSLNPKAQGRGAYVCLSGECMNKCINKKLLNKAFKMNIPDNVYNELGEEYAGYKQ